MTTDSWVLITADGWAGSLAAARRIGGQVVAVVVGPRELADEVAAAGPDRLLWVEAPAATPAEAYAVPLAAVIADASPRVLVSGQDPAARVLLGAAAARCGATLLPGVVDFSADGGRVLVRRAVIGGETVETCAVNGPVAALYAGEDAAATAPAPAAVVERVDLGPAAVSVLSREPLAEASGLDDAQRVVSFGRGVKAKDDVALIRGLAETIGAELACSMPVADDLGWLDKSRYVGRSGNHIAPALYLAVGIAGAPQHLEGVRGARIVAAINIAPAARIFHRADYGIVGDLYEVVPALVAELNK